MLEQEGTSSSSGLWPILFDGTGFPFNDMPLDAWYYSYVFDAYSEGLINNVDERTYSPEKNLTITEAIKLFASRYPKFNGGMMQYNNENYCYDPYVNCAVVNYVFEGKYWSYIPIQMNVAIMRSEFVRIKYSTMAQYDYTPMNEITDDVIPNVKPSHTMQRRFTNSTGQVS